MLGIQNSRATKVRLKQMWQHPHSLLGHWDSQKRWCKFVFGGKASFSSLSICTESYLDGIIYVFQLGNHSAKLTKLMSLASCHKQPPSGCVLEGLEQEHQWPCPWTIPRTAIGECYLPRPDFAIIQPILSWSLMNSNEFCTLSNHF